MENENKVMTALAFQFSTNDPMFWIMVIIAVCFAVMAIAMLAMAVMVSRVVGTVNRLQQQAEPLIATANRLSLQGKDLADKGKEIAEQFGYLSEHLTTATRHLSESAGLIKEEVVEIRALVSQTAVTAKDKVALVSQTIERTNGQVIETADFIQTKVVEPAREFAAIMAGLRRGLEVLLAPSPKPLDRVYGDDEMFIG